MSSPSEHCPTCGKALTKGRSGEQNRTYWGNIVTPLASYLEGYSTDEVHELLKYKFLSQFRFVKSPKNGTVEEVRLIKSTTKLTTKEFMTFMEACIRWASELGCPITMPGDPVE